MHVRPRAGRINSASIVDRMCQGCRRRKSERRRREWGRACRARRARRVVHIEARIWKIVEIPRVVLNPIRTTIVGGGVVVRELTSPLVRVGEEEVWGVVDEEMGVHN